MGARKQALASHFAALSRMELLDSLRAIAKRHHVLLDDVFSSIRSKRVMDARAACYVFLRAEGFSYPEIGRLMLRDHSTILYALHKRDDELQRFQQAKRDAETAAQAAAVVGAGAEAKRAAS